MCIIICMHKNKKRFIAIPHYIININRNYVISKQVIWPYVPFRKHPTAINLSTAQTTVTRETMPINRGGHLTGKMAPRRPTLRTLSIFRIFELIGPQLAGGHVYVENPDTRHKLLLRDRPGTPNYVFGFESRFGVCVHYRDWNSRYARSVIVVDSSLSFGRFDFSDGECAIFCAMGFRFIVFVRKMVLLRYRGAKKTHSYVSQCYRNDPVREMGKNFALSSWS